MRMAIKKLLKKHKYPPEGMEDAVQTVMTQCELWTDNTDMETAPAENIVYMPTAEVNLYKNVSDGTKPQWDASQGFSDR